MRTPRGPTRPEAGRFVRFAKSMGSPLEWSDVQKAILLLVPPIPFVVFYIFRIERLRAYPNFEPYIDRPSITRVEHMLWGFLVLFGVLATAWSFLRKSEGKHPWFVRATIHTWFISIAVSSYAVGPFSSPVLVGFLAGGMAAFLLFDAAKASFGAVIGMLVLVGTTVLERLHVLPYGPVFAGVVFGGERPPDEWIFWNLVFTVVLTSFVLATTGLVMTIARQRQAELDVLLRVDSLTELANRRTLDAALELEVSRAKRTRAPLSVMMLDLDHFKRINDTYGHRTGDAVLAAVGVAIRAVSRDIDTAGRYGGEEMLLLLPDTDLAGARAAAERVRQAIEELVVTTDAGQPVRVTVSAGCAVFGAEGVADGATLVREADEALYRAKAQGRNRVVAGTSAAASPAGA